MSRGAVVADMVKAQARSLKMPGLLREYEGLARQAGEERWSHEECSRRRCSRGLSPVSGSGSATPASPSPRLSNPFDFGATEGADPAQVTDLARDRWIADAENLILAGPIGTGKTHLAIALGLEAARLRRHVAFWRAADLVRALLEARDNRELTRLQRSHEPR